MHGFEEYISTTFSMIYFHDNAKKNLTNRTDQTCNIFFKLNINIEIRNEMNAQSVCIVLYCFVFCFEENLNSYLYIIVKDFH